MTKKTYTITKAVKVDGVEYSAGEDVGLEPGQAQALLGTFVDEKVVTTKSATHAVAAPAPIGGSGKAKGADGL